MHVRPLLGLLACAPVGTLFLEMATPRAGEPDNPVTSAEIARRKLAVVVEVARVLRESLG